MNALRRILESCTQPILDDMPDPNAIKHMDRVQLESHIDSYIAELTSRLDSVVGRSCAGCVKLQEKLAKAEGQLKKIKILDRNEEAADDMRDKTELANVKRKMREVGVGKQKLRAQYDALKSKLDEAEEMIAKVKGHWMDLRIKNAELQKDLDIRDKLLIDAEKEMRMVLKRTTDAEEELRRLKQGDAELGEVVAVADTTLVEEDEVGPIGRELKRKTSDENGEGCLKRMKS